MKSRSESDVIKEIEGLTPQELDALVGVLSKNTECIGDTWQWALQNLSGSWDHYPCSSWHSRHVIQISKIRKRMRAGLGLTGQEIDRE